MSTDRLSPLAFGTQPYSIDDSTASAYDPRRQYGVGRADLGSALASTQTTQTFDSKGQPKDMDHDR